MALAERDRLGGECTNDGCVPTKVMLRSARIAQTARDAERFGVRIPTVEIDFAAVRERVRAVIDHQTREGPRPFERLGITVHLQEARLAGDRPGRARRRHRGGRRARRARDRDRAHGAARPRTRRRPVLDEQGGDLEAGRAARLAVVGAGAVGIEFAQIYSRFGTRVTVLEVLPQILPNEDHEAAAALAPVLEGEGVRLLPDTTLERAEHDGRRWTLTPSGGGAIEADEVLVAAGRRPVFDVHDLDAAGIELDDAGRPVLTDTLRTTAPNVWVAGDGTGELLFTHVGSYEAVIVVDDILGTPRPRDYRVVPRVTFCDPEVASVGLTELAAAEAGHEVRTATVPLSENERSLIDGRPEGLVKLVADARTGELLGGHIVGEEAGAMIHEVVAAMAGLTPATVGGAIHAYPTFSESVQGAFVQLAERS